MIVRRKIHLSDGHLHESNECAMRNVLISDPAGGANKDSWNELPGQRVRLRGFGAGPDRPLDFSFQVFGALARQLPLRLGKEEPTMLYYALIFLLVGLVAGALGLFGVAAIASQIAWILFLIGVVMLVVHLATSGGRGARVP
jgi:uncharacterized membrane protein YtjA (UPF0391 family)